MRQHTFKRRADYLDIAPTLNRLLDFSNTRIVRVLQILNKLVETMNILELVDLVQRDIRELRELEPILVRLFDRFRRRGDRLCQVGAELDSRQ